MITGVWGGEVAHLRAGRVYKRLLVSSPPHNALRALPAAHRETTEVIQFMLWCVW